MKNSYILLRNNKESRSLNLDALQQIGLKSTDLVWVECQSVCWQHPHEIAELKGLVAENNIQAVQQVKIQQTESIAEYDEIIPQKNVEKKLVFAELSAIVNSDKKQSSAETFFDSDVSEMHKYGGLSSSENITFEKKYEDSSRIHYSRPLDEIKEMYVKNLEQQSKSQKKGIQIKLPANFKKIAVYSGLVVTGALLMLLINTITGGKKSPVITQQKNVPQNTVKNTEPTIPAEPVQTITEEPVYDPNELSGEEGSLPEIETSAIPLKKKATEKKESENSVQQGDTNKGKVEKESPQVKEVTEPKPVISAETISSKLSLKPNDYVVAAFGGIRKLEMTLHNNSKYLVDKVSAELQYLNPEGKVLKTESIYFQSVPAGGTETITVKKSNRGVKVIYRITGIQSKEISNGTAGL